MRKERETVIRQAIILLDAFIIAASFFCAYIFRESLPDIYSFDLFPSVDLIGAPVSFDNYLPTIFIWVPIWVLTLAFSGAYSSFRIRSFFEIVWIVIKAAMFALLIFGSLAFILKIQFLSRVFLAIFVGIGSISLIFEKWIIVSVAHTVRKKGMNLHQLLIVGTGTRARRFIAMIRKHPEWGFRIVGLIDDEAERVGKNFFGFSVIGVLNDIPRIIREDVIDEVVFVVPRRWLERVQKSIAACELQGINTSVAADLFDLKIARGRQTNFGSFPILLFETNFGREWQLFIKRTIDLAVSISGLIALMPGFLIIAVLVKMTSPGPVLFKQKRVTLHGRVFTLYKFRSMYRGANEKLQEMKHLNEVDGPVFKVKNDPRVTPFGRFLRKSSIDELPQLFNVFMGQMSLVGPRPPLPDEVKEYELWQIRRLSMRSGITCLWQISGRSRITFKKWMELDLKYIDNWSLWEDFNILLKTIPAVLLSRGAQ